MCSTTAEQIARICGAIEELAGRSGEPGGVTAAIAAMVGQPGDAAGTGGATGDDEATGPAGPALATRLDGMADADRTAAGDDVTDRLAAIWAMIADLDPELARRLPGYLTAAD